MHGGDSAGRANRDIAHGHDTNTPSLNGEKRKIELAPKLGCKISAPAVVTVDPGQSRWVPFG